MVFFSCNSCGESLKKNMVEKHYNTVCRRSKSLSCIDCNKEFWGQEYEKHTKCITEEEKYSGKNYVAKPGANKGELKQNNWCQQVQSAIEHAKSDGSVLQLLQRIKDYPNIPRKQAKFKNFLKSSFRVNNEGLIERVWNLISTHAVKAKSEQENTPVETSNGHVESQDNQTECTNKAQQEKELKERMKKDRKEERKKRKKQDTNVEEKQENNVEKKKKKKKRKREEDEEIKTEESVSKKPTLDSSQEIELDNTEEPENSEELEDGDMCTEKADKVKFNWEEVITAVLKSKGEITLKKLRKKVLAEYVSLKGEPRSSEKLMAKFNKKVTKNPTFKVHKERVKLKS